MKVSIYIITQEKDFCQDKIEKLLKEIESKPKAANIMGEVWFLKAVNGII
jgi:hypothetical protein